MHFDFRTNFIYWENVEKHNFYKSHILSQIYKNPEKEIINEEIVKRNNFYENLYSTLDPDFSSNINANNQLDYDNLREEVILPAFHRMIEELSLNIPTNIKIKELWTHLYLPGGYVRAHAHEKADVSGIYIVKLNEDNNTIFLDFSPSTIVKHYYESGDFSEGTIAMWPAHLVHETIPCKEPRVIIAFDIECDTETRGE